MLNQEGNRNHTHEFLVPCDFWPRSIHRLYHSDLFFRARVFKTNFHLFHYIQYLFLQIINGICILTFLHLIRLKIIAKMKHDIC